MQYGMTIPLQNFLKEVKPPYGSVENLFFCWEIHKIMLQGQSTLVAVNANNRFMAVLSPMGQSDWTCLVERVTEAIRAAFASEGYTQVQIDTYFRLAGAIEITKTHGRKPVAGLNKAIDQLCRVPVKLGTRSTFQDFHCKAVNREPYRPAGYAAYGLPVEYLEQDMRKYCGAQGE